MAVNPALPFYFAWTDPGEAFDADAHGRKDEDIFKIDVDHSEGDFATLTLVVKNPRIGLLAPARKVWAWLSWWDGAELAPLFFGRLVGVPTDINQELVTLLFTARPEDFVSLKDALAETLRVPPHYDPVFINPSSLDDPDTVLEARSALWAVDRVTHEVSVSDILVGEDGVEEFLESEVPHDSVSIKLGQTPLRSVTVDATVNWTQRSSGRLPFKLDVETYTGQSLIQDWPKAGASLQGGWGVLAASAVDVNGVELVQNMSFNSTWTNHETKHSTGDAMSLNNSGSRPLLRGPALYHVITEKSQTGVIDPGDALTDTFGGSDPINIPAHSEQTAIHVPLWHVVAGMTLQYDAARARKEHVRFTLATNVQAIVTLPGDSEALSIKVDSVDVGLPVAGGDAPISDPARHSYFPTDRGLESLEYLICLARANLLIRSRAVEVAFNCRFERAVALTMRKNALLHDDRLPGHQAVGKIVNYKFSVDGSTGLAIGSVTMGCAIGYGGAVAGDAGEPTYAEEDYVEESYQAYTDHVVVLPASDVSYTSPVDAPDDDGLVFPLTKARAVVREHITGRASDQAALIEASFAADIVVASTSPTSIEEQEAVAQAQTRTTTEVLKRNPVSYSLELRPLTTGPFENAYDVVVSQLEVPKQLDLEAAT